MRTRGGARAWDERAVDRALARAHASLFGASEAPRFGRFVVRRRLAIGGMGIVYDAWDPTLRRPVAVKVVRIDAEGASSASIVEEAKALAKLSHPDIVQVFDVGRCDDGVFLAMELVEGRTLRTWLRERPRSWPEIADAFGVVAGALAAAHCQRIVHRDLKPDNIMMRADGRPIVLDFGLARALVCEPTEDDDTAPQTRPCGTPPYMAPEQFRGRCDPRSDQFSFCASLYEALHGCRPFAGSSAEHECAPVDPRTAPAWLLRICERGLQRHPDDRFANMGEIVAALRRGRARRHSPLVWCAGAIALTAWLAVPSEASVPPSTVEAAVPDEVVPDDRVDRLVAHASLVLGMAESRGGKAGSASRRLQDAVHAGTAAGADRTAARAAVELVYVEGYQLGHHDAGERWASIAATAIHRAGGDPELELARGKHLATIAAVRGRLADAERRYRDLLVQVRERFGVEHRHAAGIETSLATVLAHQGRTDDALALFEHARSVLVDVHGPHHPEVAMVDGQIGTMHAGAGRQSEAIAALRRAIATYERTIGLEHGTVVTLRLNLGVALLGHGEPDAAMLELEGARRTMRRLHGDAHPQLAQILHNQGLVELARDRPADALVFLQRAADLKVALLGPEHPNVAVTLQVLERARAAVSP